MIHRAIGIIKIQKINKIWVSCDSTSIDVKETYYRRKRDLIYENQNMCLM